MKLVFFANTANNLINFRKNLIRNFVNKNNEIILIFQKEPDNQKFYNFFKSHRCKVNEIYLSRHSLNPLKELITFFQLFFIYRNIKPDIAFHFTIKANIYGSIISYLNKVYSVNNISGLGYFFLQKG